METLKSFVLVLAIALQGCTSVPSGPEINAEGFAGVYGSFVGHVGALELMSNGKYSCFVTNGSVDGCLTVDGSGSSNGTWIFDGNLIVFSPESETNNLVLSFQAATAVPSPTGLILHVHGFEYSLQKGSF